MAGKWLNKDEQTLLAREQTFFGVKAPAGIPDRHFDTAEAVRNLIRDLEAIGPTGDVPTEGQIAGINAAYEALEQTVRGDVTELEKKLKSAEMLLGRYKKKIEKLEGAS